MELLNSSLKDKDAELIARMILDHSINIDTFLQILDENPNWLEDNISGEISCSSLLEILKASYHNQKYSVLLTYLIEVIDGNIIDDLVFETILFHPDDDIKERMLISLAHKKLKESQLRYLCNDGTAFECYFELAILYYTESAYTLENLKSFMEEFSKGKYSYMTEELLAELVDYHVPSTKTKYEYIIGLHQTQGNCSVGEQRMNC